MANQLVETRTQGMMSAQSDEELMAALCNADGDALAALFHRYHRLVFRVARGILRDGAEAEDVTQEVFLEVYRKAYLYDRTRGTVRVWLLQYAYHRTLRRKAALRRRAAYRGEPLDQAEPHLQGLPRLLNVEECRWILRAGLARLPARQRKTLELVCIDELTLREVAHRLQVSLGSARHYYYRGLAALRAWALVADRWPDVPASPEASVKRRLRRPRSKKAIKLMPGQA